MANRTPFRLADEFQKAWDYLWNAGAEMRASKDEWTRNKAAYLTATDLEHRIRAAAAERLDGVEEGCYGNWGGGVRISTGTRTSLLSLCRDWLLTQVRRGILRADHPSDRHTVTGLRFRPAGEELTAPEKKAKETPREEKARRAFIRHFAKPSNPKVALCKPETAKKRFPSFRSSGWKPSPTTEREKVTCKHCLRLLVNLPQEAQKEEAPVTA